MSSGDRPSAVAGGPLDSKDILSLRDAVVESVELNRSLSAEMRLQQEQRNEEFNSMSSRLAGLERSLISLPSAFGECEPELTARIRKEDPPSPDDCLSTGRSSVDSGRRQQRQWEKTRSLLADTVARYEREPGQSNSSVTEPAELAAHSDLVEVGGNQCTP